MKRIFSITSLIGVSIILFTLSSCDSDMEGQEMHLHQFMATCEVLNPQTQFFEGDTLWIESVLPEELYANDGEEYSIENTDIFYDLILKRWDTEDANMQQVFTIPNSVYYMSHTHLNKASAISLAYFNSNNKYKWKTGIVFNKAGIFSIDTDSFSQYNNANSDGSIYGGGEIYFDDDSNLPALLDLAFSNEDRNLELYENLSSEYKSFFQSVDSFNDEKYYFIKVLPKEIIK